MNTNKVARLMCDPLGTKTSSTKIFPLTVDEVVLAGGKLDSSNFSYYLLENATDSWWWTGSLAYFDCDVDDFKLVDAILHNRVNIVKDCIKAGRLSGLEFLSYAGRILNSIKTLILVEYTNLPGSEIGITDKKCNYMRFNRSSFTLPDLQKKLDAVSELDLKLKSGLLDMSSDCQMDYLLMRLMHG